MMKKNLFKELFNCELYLLQTITNNKPYCICDYDKEHIYTGYTLIKIFEYFKAKEPIKLLEYLDTDKNNIIDGKKPKDLTREEAIYELTINCGQKAKGYITKLKDLMCLECTCVHDLNFEPSEKRILKMNNKIYLNLHFQKKLINGIKPNIAAKFPCREKLLKNLIGDGYDHFINFLAYKVQFPHKQIPTHWVIIDDGGTGKTKFFANMILKSLFEISIITQSDLEGQYTHYIAQKQFVICEEIESFSNNKKLKALTGAESFTINEKHKPQYEVTNYSNFIIFSNDIKAIHIDSRDRRWNITGGAKKLFAFDGDWSKALFASEAENKDFFKTMEQTNEEESKSFYSYLLARPVKEKDIFELYQSDYKDTLLDMNQSSYDSFINSYLETDLISMINACLPNNRGLFEKNNIVYKDKGNNTGYWLRSQGLYELYHQFCLTKGFKPGNSNNFRGLIWKHPKIHNIFETSKLISHEGIKIQSIKLKTYKDDNLEIN